MIEKASDASILGLYAISPCHVGSGISVGVIDLPIQRERHTNWPVIQASGVKGALRAHFERAIDNDLINNIMKDIISQLPSLKIQKDPISDSPSRNNDEKIHTEVKKIFTSLVFGGDDYAGSLSVGDVKILAFPMRSNIAPFVWITCPEVLKRLNRDLALIGRTKTEIDFQKLQSLEVEKAFWITPFKRNDCRILLEDMEVTATEQFDLNTEKDNETNNTIPIQSLLEKADRLLVVHDEIFKDSVTYCTQVMAQIKIDQETGTTASSSLRYQEELPADTLMYTVIFWDDCRRKNDVTKKNSNIKELINNSIAKYATQIKAKDTRDYIVKAIHDYIQIGGDETLGRGLFEVKWF